APQRSQRSATPTGYATSASMWCRNGPRSRLPSAENNSGWPIRMITTRSNSTYHRSFVLVTADGERGRGGLAVDVHGGAWRGGQRADVVGRVHRRGCRGYRQRRGRGDDGPPQPWRRHQQRSDATTDVAVSAVR